jgi:NADH-quinone oxidoreductase subunit M
MLAAIGVPGTSGAPGELLILAAAFARAPGIGALAVLVIVLSAGYCLALLRSVLSGPGDVRHADIGWRDRALVIPLLALVVAIGVAPRAIGDLAEPAGEQPGSAR